MSLSSLCDAKIAMRKKKIASDVKGGKREKERETAQLIMIPFHKLIKHVYLISNITLTPAVH